MYYGVIENVRYQPMLTATLRTYPFSAFDINAAKSSGIVTFDDNNNSIGYSKWVSPKRTRSYPFNFITLSWMNLANVYVILAWYDTAQ